MISRADHHLSLYVPSRTRRGRRSHRGVTPDAMLTVAVNFFAYEFGGATVVAGEGHHVFGTPPRRRQEQVHIVSAFATSTGLKKHLRALKELAADFCVRFDQQSVAYEIDGVFRMVIPPPSMWRETDGCGPGHPPLNGGLPAPGCATLHWKKFGSPAGDSPSQTGRCSRHGGDCPWQN